MKLRRVTKKPGVQSKIKPTKKSSADDKRSQENNEHVPFKCSYCEKSFATKRSCNIHSRIHLNERELDCSICDKVFKHPSRLKYHKDRVHLKIKSYLCRMCNKKFSWLSALNAHMRIHTHERPYKCPICSANFISAGSLQRHRATHFEDRNYKCSLCEKTFKTTGARGNHIHLFHSDVRRYNCSVCNKAFKTNATMKRHEKLIHIGGQPYKCCFCKKKFSTKANKETHERFHSEEKLYKCSFCEKSYRFGSSKSRHEKSHTAEESLQNKTVGNNPPKTKASRKTSEENQITRKKSSSNTPVKRSFDALKKTRNVEKTLREKKVCNKKRENEGNLKTSERTRKSEKPDTTAVVKQSTAPRERIRCSKKKLTTKANEKTYGRINTKVTPNKLLEKPLRFKSNKNSHDKSHTDDESVQNKKVCNTPHKTKQNVKSSEGAQTSQKVSTNKPVKGSFAPLEKFHKVENSFQQKIVCKKACKNETNANTSEITPTGENPSPSTFLKGSSAQRRIRNRRIARFWFKKRFYSCTTCLKSFRTYQKLISHRLTHKKLRRYYRIIVLSFA